MADKNLAKKKKKHHQKNLVMSFKQVILWDILLQDPK